MPIGGKQLERLGEVKLCAQFVPAIFLFGSGDEAKVRMPEHI